jgi:DNA-binding transcriptional MerR regulator
VRVALARASPSPARLTLMQTPTPQPPSESDQSYRIGVVSRMTGIPSDTIRVWERRYQVVAPDRTPGHKRMYSREDVERLRLIKRLVDLGHAIGTVAKLDLQQLGLRLRDHAAATGGVIEPFDEARPRAAVVGMQLRALVRAASGEGVLAGLELAGEADDLRGLAVDPEDPPDLLIVELPALQPEDVDELHAALERSGARGAVLVYGFTNQAALRRLDAARITAVQGPITEALVRDTVEGVVRRAGRFPHLDAGYGLQGLHPTALPPPPAFSPAQLAAIIGAARTVTCECPQHLVRLVQSLTDFERYSEACEHRNAADAALHARLRLATGHARGLIEAALRDVCAIEGIRVPRPDAP